MIFDLLFRVGPAIQAIFKLGYEPKEEFFYELTFDQYAQLKREGTDISKKWFTLIPDDHKLDVPELLIVDENEKNALLDAAKYIHNFCASDGKAFLSFDQKLEYVASQIPSVFSDSSKYSQTKSQPKLKIVK